MQALVVVVVDSSSELTPVSTRSSPWYVIQLHPCIPHYFADHLSRYCV